MGREVEVGRSPLGEALTVDIERSTVVTVAGMSGCGKTSLCNGLMAGIAEAYREAVQFVVLDPKSGLGFIPWKRRAEVLGSAAGWPAALGSIQSEIDRRFMRMAELEETELSPCAERPLIVVVCDELPRLVDHPVLENPEKAGVKKALEDISCRGRQAKVCLLLIGQSLGHEVISTTTRSNAGCTIAMRTNSAPVASQGRSDGPSPMLLPPLPGFFLMCGPTTGGRWVKGRAPDVDARALRARMDALALTDFRKLPCLDYGDPGYLG